MLPSYPPQYVRLPEQPIRRPAPDLVLPPPVTRGPGATKPPIDRGPVRPAPAQPSAPPAVPGKMDKNNLSVPLPKAQDNLMDAMRANIDGYKLFVADLAKARAADAASTTGDHSELEKAQKLVDHLRDVLTSQVAAGADIGLSGDLDATGDKLSRFQALVDEIGKLGL